MSLPHHYNQTSLLTPTHFSWSYLLSFCLCSTFSYWEKKGTNLSVCSVIICDVLLLCVWKKLSKWHLTVWATTFTFYSNSCKREWIIKKRKITSQVSFEIPLKKDDVVCRIIRSHTFLLKLPKKQTQDIWICIQLIIAIIIFNKPCLCVAITMFWGFDCLTSRLSQLNSAL